jgi:hypothetical protein
MIKTVIIVAVATISMPAIAQTAPAAGQNASMPQTAPQQQSVDASAATAGGKTGPQTATGDVPAATSTATAAATPAGTTTSNDSSAVQQVVDQGWSQYDKDGNGVLSKAEFAAWMIDLRAQSDPKAKSSAKTTAWANGAFINADKDKSRTVSKTELASYLAGGTGGAGSK